MSYPTDNFIHNILKMRKADIGIKIWVFYEGFEPYQRPVLIWLF